MFQTGAAVIADFMGRYPGVRARLSLTDRSVDLVEEGLDIVITVRQADDSSHAARRLSDFRMIVCAADGYLARAARPQQPEEQVTHK